MKRNIVANYVGMLWGAAVQIVLVPVYIRFLGMESYGLIGFYTTLQVWLMMLDFGLTPTVNREMARYLGGAINAEYTKALFLTFEVACLALAATSFMALAAGSSWLSKNWFILKHLTAHQVQISIIMMGGVIVTRWMNNFYRGALQGLQKQVWMNVAWVTFVSIRSIGVLAILAWISPTIVAYFIYQGVVSVAEAIVMRVGVIRTIPKVPRASVSVRQLLAEHMHFAGNMTILTLLGVAISQSDKVILTKILPLNEFGYYALATTIANGLLAVVAPVFGAVGPRLTEDAARKDSATLTRNYETGTDLITVLVYPLTAMLIFLGGPMITAWSGNAALAQHVIPYLALLALGTAFFCLAHMPYALQLAYAWTRLPVVLNAATVIILIPALIMLVPRYGPTAAAAAWAILNAVGLVVQMLMVHRRLLPKGQTRRWLRLTFFYPGVIVLVLFSGARLAFEKLLAGATPVVTILFIAAVTGTAIAAVAAIEPTGRVILERFVTWVQRRIRTASLPPHSVL